MDNSIFLEQMQELLAGRQRAHRFSGVVLIKQGERELFKTAVGYANRAWRIENQVDTRFRIASIAKMFTAVAILQLIETGKLALDTRVVELLELANTRIPPEVTLYHLLTMTSGIADWFDESGGWEEEWTALWREHPIYHFRRNEDYLPLFVNKPPLTAVDQKYQYNGAGYILLGLVIEKIAGLTYFDYVRRHIFAKVNMTRSDFCALDGVEVEVAEGYIPLQDDDGRIVGWKKNIYSTTPEAAADGGATSTLADLARFAQALRAGELLSAAMTQAMLTPKVLEDDEPFRGYTWKYGFANEFLLDSSDHIVRWGHTGEEDGVSGRLYHYPPQNLDVIILANQSWCAGSLAWEIHNLVVETGEK